MRFFHTPIIALGLVACSSSQGLFPSEREQSAAAQTPCNSKGDPHCPDNSAPTSPAACPPGTEWVDQRCIPTPETEAQPQAAGAISPYTPVNPIRDPRTRKAGARSPALLKMELQNLLALFEATPKASPDRSILAFRTAEVASELCHASEKDRAFARQKALFFYKIIAEDYANACPPEKKGCADEALYYLGLEIEMSGRMDDARKVYLRLIREYPQSRYVSYAYFAFGEYYFEAAKNERRDFALAEQVYEKAVSLNDSVIAPESLLRLLELAQMQEDSKKASKITQVLQTRYPESRAAQYLKNQSNTSPMPSN